MMDEPRSRSRSRCPWGLLGMIWLVVFTELFLVRRELDFDNEATLMSRLVERSARSRARRAGLLCLGDSQVKFDLIPQVLERPFGKRVLNLAIVGGQAPGTFSVLRDALRAGARPEAIVVDFSPINICGPVIASECQLPQLMRWDDLIDLAWMSRDGSYVGSVLCRKLLRSYHARFEIRVAVLSALRGAGPRAREVLSPFIRNVNVNHGALVAPKSPTSRKRDIATTGRNMCPPDWSCDGTQARYIRRFLKLAESEGIPVFWILPPILPELQAKRDEVGTERLYDWSARCFQTRYRNLVILDARHAHYPDEVFLDLGHLDRDGAAALSDAVGREIRAYLAGQRRADGRWVRLPLYAPVSPERRLEDIDESRLALSLLKRR